MRAMRVLDAIVYKGTYAVGALYFSLVESSSHSFGPPSHHMLACELKRISKTHTHTHTPHTHTPHNTHTRSYHTHTHTHTYTHTHTTPHTHTYIHTHTNTHTLYI